jgi:hypothetical protein
VTLNRKCVNLIRRSETKLIGTTIMKERNRDDLHFYFERPQVPGKGKFIKLMEKEDDLQVLIYFFSGEIHQMKKRPQILGK